MSVFQIPELPLTTLWVPHFVTNFTLRSFMQTTQLPWNFEARRRKKYLPFNNPVIHKNYSTNWVLSISLKFSWQHWEVTAPISRRGLKLQDMKLISQFKTHKGPHRQIFTPPATQAGDKCRTVTHYFWDNSVSNRLFWEKRAIILIQPVKATMKHMHV